MKALVKGLALQLYAPFLSWKRSVFSLKFLLLTEQTVVHEPQEGISRLLRRTYYQITPSLANQRGF
jgi:hypothetical protein